MDSAKVYFSPSSPLFVELWFSLFFPHVFIIFMIKPWSSLTHICCMVNGFCRSGVIFEEIRFSKLNQHAKLRPRGIHSLSVLLHSCILARFLASKDSVEVLMRGYLADEQKSWCKQSSCLNLLQCSISITFVLFN